MHWTYDESPDATQLLQGDVLRKTEPIQLILESIHPYYAKKPDYRFLIVLTQSCDLISRDGRPCDARYITVAAVRPVLDALARFADSVLYEKPELHLRFSSTDRRQKLRNFAESLLNNNVDDYFYLRGEAGTALPTDHCAFLKLSIALKREHYDKLLAEKVLQLKESFQHKLGHLVGRSYSRVGTRDWEKDASAGVLDDLANGVKDIDWLEKDIHKHVLSSLAKSESQEWTVERYHALVKEAMEKRKKRREEFLALVGGVLQDVGIDAAQSKDILNKLNNKTQLSAYLKP